MATTALSASILEMVDRVNAVVGSGTAEVRNERATKKSRTDIGFAGALGADRSVTPATRERLSAIIIVRSVVLSRSGQGTTAVLDRHEPVLRALFGFVPSQAEDLRLGETRPVDLNLASTEGASVETDYELRIELRSP